MKKTVIGNRYIITKYRPYAFNPQFQREASPATQARALNFYVRPLMHQYFAGLIVIFLAHTVCAADVTRRYEQSYDCGFVEIKANGAECVDEMECSSLSYVTHETHSYRIGGKSYPLPVLSKQFPDGPKILRETGRVYRISQLKCQKDQNVVVFYWGGGNCVGCEIVASYSTATGRLVPKEILRVRWDLVPFVKLYSDSAAVTRWIDPLPK